MWFQPRSTAHDGTPPAAAMPTPFNFPCGKDFLKFQQDKEQRDRCAPPGFEEYWWSSAGYYSPAICPRGYTAGCFRWHSDQGPVVEASETAVQCVPQGYACVTDDISNAFSYSESAPMIQVRWAQTDLPGFVTHPLYPGMNPTDNNLLGEGNMPTTAADAIAARQVSSGFASGTATTRDGNGGSATPTTSGTRGSSGDDDERPNFPSFDPNRGKALSIGARAGIGVAVPVVVLLILGIVGFFWRRARKNKHSQATQGALPPVDSSSQPWAQPQMTSEGGKFEMQGEGGQIVEMPPSAATANEKPELSSETSYRGAPNFPAELQSGASYQQYPNGQHNELPAASTHSPQHEYSELSGTTTEYNRPVEMDSNQQHVQVPSPTYHTPSPGLQAPAAPPPVSTPPAAAVQTQVEPEPSADELTLQQARLEERRQRLLELERIEQEQQELQQRIKAQRQS